MVGVLDVSNIPNIITNPITIITNPNNTYPFLVFHRCLLARGIEPNISVSVAEK
jgi:hypothetical protein